MARIANGLLATIAEQYHGSEPPASFGAYQRLAWAQGFEAASDGAPRELAPFQGAEWRREAWLHGHEDYHRWLQAHRVRACDRVEG